MDIDILYTRSTNIWSRVYYYDPKSLQLIKQVSECRSDPKFRSREAEVSGRKSIHIMLRHYDGFHSNKSIVSLFYLSIGTFCLRYN